MRSRLRLTGWEMLLGVLVGTHVSYEECSAVFVDREMCTLFFLRVFCWTLSVFTNAWTREASAWSYYVFCLLIIRQELMRTESHITRRTSLTVCVCVCVRVCVCVCAHERVRRSHLESRACGSRIVLCRLWLTFNPWATVCSVYVCSQLFRRV